MADKYDRLYYDEETKEYVYEASYDQNNDQSSNQNATTTQSENKS